MVTKAATKKEQKFSASKWLEQGVQNLEIAGEVAVDSASVTITDSRANLKELIALLKQEEKDLATGNIEFGLIQQRSFHTLFVSSGNADGLYPIFTIRDKYGVPSALLISFEHAVSKEAMDEAKAKHAAEAKAYTAKIRESIARDKAAYAARTISKVTA